MPQPFYNGIKGITAGAPGTGAFTPSAAATGFSPWSDVPAGTYALVRFDDGSAWSRELCYWNGTTLSRASTQVPHRPNGTLTTSTGSHLSLTSAATATFVGDASEVQSHLGGVRWAGWFTIVNSTTISNVS